MEEFRSHLAPHNQWHHQRLNDKKMSLVKILNNTTKKYMMLLLKNFLDNLRVKIIDLHGKKSKLL